MDDRLLEHILDIKERLASMETRVDQIKIDIDDHSISHGNLNGRMAGLEIGQAEQKAEMKAYVKSVKGFSVVVSLVVGLLSAAARHIK